MTHEGSAVYVPGGSGGEDSGVSDALFDSEVEQDWDSCAENGDDLQPRAVRASSTVVIWKHPTLGDVRYARVSEDKTTDRCKMAVYCYMHGFKKMRKPELFPEDHKMQAWVLAGSKLPRSAANKRAHEAEFDKLWPAPRKPAAG